MTVAEIIALLDNDDTSEEDIASLAEHHFAFPPVESPPVVTESIDMGGLAALIKREPARTLVDTVSARNEAPVTNADILGHFLC